MKNYDFIIGYEHRNREIESICLLKVELERRGYSVYIYNTNDSRLKEHINKLHAEVLVVPYAYDDKLIAFCVKRFITFNKIINLQWEQAIYKQQEDNPNSYRNPSGICKNAVHLSWGQSNVDRLVNVVGIDKRNVKLVGNIALDFLKPPLSNYYISKEELYKKYNIPVDKKICLFIASFKAGLVSNEELEILCKQYGEWRRQQHVVALESMKVILNWIEAALKENSELYFIYRPHPGEPTHYVDEIQERCERFVVIKDLSVKQWILAADKIYTWFSTAIAEIYFANKNCYILNPITLPEEACGRLFEGAKTVTDYKSFTETLGITNSDFPIETKKLNDYYLSDRGMSYHRIADVFEDVYKDMNYSIDKEEVNRIYEMSNKNIGIKKRICKYIWQLDWLYSLFWSVVERLQFHGEYFVKKSNDKNEYEKWKQIECVSNQEIQQICNKIRITCKIR